MGRVLLMGMLLATWAGARADANLLVEEPINLLGQVSPTGHVALMMEGICPETPVKVRACRAGEAGAVIGRYNNVGGYDWIAMAPGPYLYGVESVEAIPTKQSGAGLAKLREAYVQSHVSPELAGIGAKKWVQLLGTSYRRQVLAVHLRTTPEQDARLIAWLNGRENTTHFNFFIRNCADFVKDMLNVLYPGIAHRSVLFDLGMTTPKELAADAHHYAKKHPEVDFAVAVIPQVAGSIARSTEICGVTACLAWKRPYVYPLVMVEPVGALTTAAVGFMDRRYNVQGNLGTATRLEPGAARLSDGHLLMGEFE